MKSESTFAYGESMHSGTVDYATAVFNAATDEAAAVYVNTVSNFKVSGFWHLRSPSLE